MRRNPYSAHQSPTEKCEQLIRSLHNPDQNNLNLDRQPAMWMAILSERMWTEIRQISLSNCLISDFNVQALAEMEWLKLEFLFLNDNKLTAEGIIKLLDIQKPNLQYLHLTNNKIGDKGLQAILNSEKIPMLKQLCLGNNGISRVGLEVGILTASSVFSHLHTINLNSNWIGSRGVKVLTKINLSYINDFSLRDCGFGNEGGRHLSKANFGLLHNLNIGNNFMNEANEIRFYRTPEIRFYSLAKISCISSLWVVVSNCPNSTFFNIMAPTWFKDNFKNAIVRKFMNS